MFNSWAEISLSREGYFTTIFISVKTLEWKYVRRSLFEGKGWNILPTSWEGEYFVRGKAVKKQLSWKVSHPPGHRHSAHLSNPILKKCVLRKVSTKSNEIMKILCWAIDEDQMNDYGQKYASRPVLRQSKVTDVLWKVRSPPGKVTSARYTSG